MTAALALMSDLLLLKPKLYGYSEKNTPVCIARKSI